MRQEERWFISYRLFKFNFLTKSNIPVTPGGLFVRHKTIEKYYSAVVTNRTPAQWVNEHTINHHVLYAEKISHALASELIHGGAGIPAEYFDVDY